MKKELLFFCVLAQCLYWVNIYSMIRPVVLVHGILTKAENMDPLKNFIHQHFPYTYLKSVDLFGEKLSFINMYLLVAKLREEVNNDKKLRGGFSMICHSQGGLVGRHYLQRYNTPPVHTYISLASPQMGIFGAPDDFNITINGAHCPDESFHEYIYCPMAQACISVAQYWRDPYHYDQYLENSVFLPFLNNEKNHKNSVLFKENICKLENMVLIQAIHDIVVKPIQSTHFSSYDINCGQVVDLFETEWYQSDALGLKTLHESGRLHLLTADADHCDIKDNEDNFLNNIYPFLCQMPVKSSCIIQ